MAAIRDSREELRAAWAPKVLLLVIAIEKGDQRYYADATENYSESAGRSRRMSVCIEHPDTNECDDTEYEAAGTKAVPGSELPPRLSVRIQCA